MVLTSKIQQPLFQKAEAFVYERLASVCLRFYEKVIGDIHVWELLRPLIKAGIIKDGEILKLSQSQANGKIVLLGQERGREKNLEKIEIK